MDGPAPYRHGPIAIRLIRPRDARLLQHELLANRSWLRPWEATNPGGSAPLDMRTSYAPSAMAPSTLGPDVVNSHYHDGELCQLLHALDQPMAEPVKKAVRKAVRTRIKKLGMKYDNKVGQIRFRSGGSR